VHRAIDIEDSDGASRSSVLPRYLVRKLDTELRARLRAIEEATAGQIVVLVGGSATGKSRAAWEAIRAELAGWRLWHELTPGHCSADVAIAVAEGRVAAHTAVWLGDAQNYLEPSTEGPALADALAKLLALPGPRIVVATMWPAPFKRLTDRSAVPYAAVGDLLRDHAIVMPSSFTESDLAQGDNPSVMASDRRLENAAARAVDGEIVQALAGVPEIKSRYQSASRAETAILWAAADAHRLSRRWRVLSNAFLFQAAPGYLREQEWRRAQPWNAKFDAALNSLIAEAHGISGLLSLHVPRPTQDRPRGFELTDVLEEELQANRFGIFPPAEFWDSAAAVSSNEPDVMFDLGTAAFMRGRYRRAFQQFLKPAAGSGHLEAMHWVARRSWNEGDEPRARLWALRAAESGDAGEMFGILASSHAHAGHWSEAERLAWDARRFGNDDALFEVFFRCAMDATAGQRGSTNELWQTTDASAILRDRFEHMVVMNLVDRWGMSGTTAMPDENEGRLSPRLLEDEPLILHPRNPYVRVDSLRCHRHIRVELDGVVLAETHSPVLLFETGLPTRFYIDRTDVEFSHLEPSKTESVCP